MKPMAGEGLLYRNLAKMGTRLSKEDLGFRSRSLLKCERSNHVGTCSVLSEMRRLVPQPRGRPAGWEGELSLVLLGPAQ